MVSEARCFAETADYVVIDVPGLMDATPKTLPGNMREIKAALDLKGPYLVVFRYCAQRSSPYG